MRVAELGKAHGRIAEQPATEGLLQHGRGRPDNADTGRDVEAEHRPDQPELKCLVRVLEVHVPGGDHGIGVDWWRPALRLPAGGRQAVAEGPAKHEHEIDDAHGDEGLPHPGRGWRGVVVHQHGGEGRADHGAAAEAHDGHAGRHAAAVREPFYQGRDRRDVAEAETAAADDARAKPHQPKLVDIDAECRNQKATAPAEGGDHAGSAWPNPLEPAAPDGGGGAEQHEEQGEHPAEIELGPVAIGGEQSVSGDGDLAPEGGGVTGAGDGLVQSLGDADGAAEREPEHAEAVGHANAKMNGESCRRYKPAVIVGRSDNPLLVEQSEMITYGSRCRHRVMT